MRRLVHLLPLLLVAAVVAFLLANTGSAGWLIP